MSSTARHATTSTFAQRAVAMGSAVATMVVASVFSGGVAQGASSAPGSHGSITVSPAIIGTSAPGRLLHADCGVCIL